MERLVETSTIHETDIRPGCRIPVALKADGCPAQRYAYDVEGFVADPDGIKIEAVEVPGGRKMTIPLIDIVNRRNSLLSFGTPEYPSDHKGDNQLLNNGSAFE